MKITKKEKKTVLHERLLLLQELFDKTLLVFYPFMDN